MNYVELTARVAPADIERTSDVLREIAGSDVWIERPFSQRDADADALIDDAAAALVHVYVREGQRDGIVQRAADGLLARGIAAQLKSRAVAEEDWAEAWKEHFHVERFGDRIVVAPSWRTHDAGEGDVVVTLDPGMAFGTGQHETTRMCLEAVERGVKPGARVLDVGCGSGILGIAAALLGAREVLAVDVDPECVRITRENAEANGVAALIRAEQGSVGEDWPFDVPAASFGVIVANIIARVIIELSRSLVAALATDGRVIVSGVIAEREAEVIAALEQAGARIECTRAMEDWRCIEGVRA